MLVRRGGSAGVGDGPPGVRDAERVAVGCGGSVGCGAVGEGVAVAVGGMGVRVAVRVTPRVRVAVGGGGAVGWRVSVATGGSDVAVGCGVAVGCAGAEVAGGGVGVRLTSGRSVTVGPNTSGGLTVGDAAWGVSVFSSATSAAMSVTMSVLMAGTGMNCQTP